MVKAPPVDLLDLEVQLIEGSFYTNDNPANRKNPQEEWVKQGAISRWKQGNIGRTSITGGFGSSPIHPKPQRGVCFDFLIFVPIQALNRPPIQIF